MRWMNASSLRYFTRLRTGGAGLPLHMEPYGSIFVIFARPGGLHVTRVLKDGNEVASGGVSAVEAARTRSNDSVLRHANPGTYRVRCSGGREVTAEFTGPSAEELKANLWRISFQADRGAGGTTTNLRVSVVDRIAECGSALLLPDSNL